MALFQLIRFIFTRSWHAILAISTMCDLKFSRLSCNVAAVAGWFLTESFSLEFKTFAFKTFFFTNTNLSGKLHFDIKKINGSKKCLWEGILLGKMQKMCTKRKVRKIHQLSLFWEPHSAWNECKPPNKCRMRFRQYAFLRKTQQINEIFVYILNHLWFSSPAWFRFSLKPQSIAFIMNASWQNIS